jgi:hypothetical protein
MGEMRECMGKAHSPLCISIRSDTAHRLIIKLHDDSGNLVAQCSLRHKFTVKANGNKQGHIGYHGPPARQQTQRPTFPAPYPPPAPVLKTRAPVPPMHIHPASVNRHSQLNPNFSASILQRLAPTEGPISGGLTILLSGINFPLLSQQIIYARFGSVVVPTVWLLFLPLRKTNSIHSSGTTNTHSNASCLLLPLRGQSVLHSHYTMSPEHQNSAGVTAGLYII